MVKSSKVPWCNGMVEWSDVKVEYSGVPWCKGKVE